MPIPVLDLFACAGGFSWGFEFESERFQVKLAIEKVKQHTQTYAKNFPDTDVVCADILDISGEWIVSRMGHPFIVIGGPPCQSFSMQGKRSKSDPRLQLIYEFKRVVCEVEAPYFLLENVEGLVWGDMKLVFDDLCQQFTESGYTVAYKVLDAADYGIPQRRRRVFLMGCRPGYTLPKFPEPRGRVTVAEALADLPVVERHPELFLIDALPYSCLSEPVSEYSELMRSSPPEQLTGLMRSRHEPPLIAKYIATEPGQREPTSHCPKLRPDDVAPTLLGGSLGARNTALRPIHYEYPRVLLKREGARLQSFPDNFIFADTMLHAWNQIGNAVPPMIARYFAQEFDRALT